MVIEKAGALQVMAVERGRGVVLPRVQCKKTAHAALFV